MELGSGVAQYSVTLYCRRMTTYTLKTRPDADLAVSSLAAEFAAELRPYVARVAREGMDVERTVEAAALLWKADEDRAFSRRWAHMHLIVDHLADVRDEIRREARDGA
jgi:hypothetical protein